MSLPFDLRNDYVSQLSFLARPTATEDQPAPELVLLNEPLAVELGLSPEWLRSNDGLAFLLGHCNPTNQPTQALAYSGHQFGQFNPSMGDGRAALLGEIATDTGLVDIHLKGSGLTPWSRRGADGRGTLSSMLREYVMSEAMHALGIPTTRSLAVIATGRPIQRQRPRPEPAGIVVRIARSHIRVGTFQYAALTGGETATKALADYAINRHYPALSGLPTKDKYLRFFTAVMDKQCHTVAQWQAKGFIHGVMNTDNTTVSGETIDYGPCAFMEHYSPTTVFSSIDTGARYAYGNQPAILGWNLTRLAETLLPLFDPNPDTALSIATSAVETFPQRFDDALTTVMARGFGIATDHADAEALTRAYTAALTQHSPDITLANRALIDAAAGDPAPLQHLLPESDFPARLLAAQPSSAGLESIHPLVIPRNRPLDHALTHAADGDLAPLTALLADVQNPYAPPNSPQAHDLLYPDADGLAGFRTYCGT